MVSDKRRNMTIRTRNRLSRLLAVLFSVPAPVMILCPIAIAALMTWVFVLGNQDSPLAYMAYVAAAWCLAVLVIAALRGRPTRAASILLHRNARIARIVDDRDHRTVLGLRAALAVDALWALGNLTYGTWTASTWLITLGVYYLLLAVMRAVLLRDIHCGDDTQTVAAMRLCGALIVALVFVVSGFITLTTSQQGGFSYPDIVIYAAAICAFFSLGTSVAGIVSNRRHAQQSMFAVSGVNLASALVFVLTLEVAMMSLFGAGENPGFILLMNALTGAGVAAADVVIGVALIRRSRRLQDEVLFDMTQRSVSTNEVCSAGRADGKAR